MYFIDSHTHLKTLTWKNLEEMYLAGIREIISPIHFDAAKPIDNIVIIETWKYLVETHFSRAKSNFIKPHAMIGISMVGAPKDNPEMLYKILPDYLRREETVAIGEIGFEPSSRTNNNIDFQESLIRNQLKIAKKMNIPVVFHVPNPPELKKKYTEKTLSICKEHNMTMINVLIDHCSEINIKTVLDSGAFAGISVQPFRKMTPEMAAKIIKKHGYDKIMLNSDFGSLPSDHLAVPKTAFALKKLDCKDKEIEKVCCCNAREFYKI